MNERTYRARYVRSFMVRPPFCGSVLSPLFIYPLRTKTEIDMILIR